MRPPAPVFCALTALALLAAAPALAADTTPMPPAAPSSAGKPAVSDAQALAAARKNRDEAKGKLAAAKTQLAQKRELYDRHDMTRPEYERAQQAVTDAETRLKEAEAEVTRLSQPAAAGAPATMPMPANAVAPAAGGDVAALTQQLTAARSSRDDTNRKLAAAKKQLAMKKELFDSHDMTKPEYDKAVDDTKALETQAKAADTEVERLNQALRDARSH